MGAIKQLHIDCQIGKPCMAQEYQSTCYNGGYEVQQDEDPTEPPVSTEGSDRDPNIDMDRD